MKLLHFHQIMKYEVIYHLVFCLDQNKTWQSYGLLVSISFLYIKFLIYVGALTNHYQTQCLSTLTSALIFLPIPINYFVKNNNLSWITISINMFYFGIIS